MAADDRPMTDLAQRNLDAEVRAVEAGHRALLDHAGDEPWANAWAVVSDTHHSKRYLVALAMRPWHAGEPLSWLCEPRGRRAYDDDHVRVASPAPGVVPCMHAALVARRLEREGLAELNDRGQWVATEQLASEPDMPADPFAGL